MSSMDSNGRSTSVKTLAIRLEPELHARLSLIAQLRGSTITDEIREAIERHIVAQQANPDLASQAGSVLEDIEREAAARRDAIATLFGTTGQPATGHASASKPTSRSRGRKVSEESSGS